MTDNRDFTEGMAQNLNTSSRDFQSAPVRDRGPYVGTPGTGFNQETDWVKAAPTSVLFDFYIDAYAPSDVPTPNLYPGISGAAGTFPAGVVGSGSFYGINTGANYTCDFSVGAAGVFSLTQLPGTYGITLLGFQGGGFSATIKALGMDGSSTTISTYTDSGGFSVGGSLSAGVWTGTTTITMTSIWSIQISISNASINPSIDNTAGITLFSTSYTPP